MSFERHDVAFYDGGANLPFAKALVDMLVVPAYFSAVDKKGKDKPLDGDLIADTEVWCEGNRTRYEFFAPQQKHTVSITSTTYSVLDNLSESSAQLIYDDIQASNITDDLKSRYQNSSGYIQAGTVVETFTRRAFYIYSGSVDMNEVRVKTQLGYSVDGLEITQDSLYEEESDLDRERENVFQVSEVTEIVRALLALGFINEEDVKRFFDQEF